MAITEILCSNSTINNTNKISTFNLMNLEANINIKLALLPNNTLVTYLITSKANAKRISHKIRTTNLIKNLISSIIQ